MEIKLVGLENAQGMVIRVRRGGTIEIDASDVNKFVSLTSDQESPSRYCVPTEDCSKAGTRCGV